MGESGGLEAARKLPCPLSHKYDSIPKCQLHSCIGVPLTLHSGPCSPCKN